MEGLGAEVTQKIKSAIQAKLMELNAYVDDELPDYVMVMVGNKRSKTQMENDLQLFLGSNTVPFTSWLYQVLQKLQEVTVASKSNAAVKSKRRERTPSVEEDEDCINIKAETDGDFIEEDVSPKARKPEKTGRSKSDRAKSLEKEKPIEYLPSKIKDRKHTTEDISERKVEKISKETNTVNRKRVSSRDESNLKKSSNLESSVTSTNREESVSKDDIRKKRSSCSPNKDKLSDKVMYDARELLNRKKAEKLASKDLSTKQRSDQVKRKRDRTPEDRHSKRVVTHSDSDIISHRLSAPKDGERERNGRDKDSALKSTIHRTTLKRKMLEDDRNEDRSDRWKEDKRTDNTRSNKVIRISETVQAEQEILKSRASNKTVTSGHDRKSVHSRIAPSKETNREAERDRERDRDRDRDAGVSSIVRITPRPKRPASQQPSSSLILKAVAEANKSLAAAPARPLPPTQSRNLERPLRGKISPDKITVTLPNHRVQPVSKDDINSHNAYSNDTDNGRKQQRLKEINEEEEENGKVDESDLLSGSHDKDGIALSCTNASYSTNSHVTTTSDKATAVDKEADEAINQWLRGVEESNPLKPLPDSFSSQETDLDSEPVLEICQNMSELEPEEEPEFVVTLHGLDPGMFPKVNENDDEEDEDYNYSKDEDEDNMEMENLNHHHHRHNVFNNNKKEIELNADSEELMFDPTDELIENRKTSSPILSSSDASPEKNKRTSSPIIIVKQNNYNNSVNNSNNNLQVSAGDVSDGVKLKSLERCKYWPNCLLGDKCSYHHPSSMCKTFPGCKYGDTCLFIHPTCKFGMSCTRRDCLYMHGTAGTPKVKVNQTPGALQYCRFYPNCSNVNCQFYHPKPCRFGRYCTKKDCLFEHKKAPTKDKLKWTRTPTSAAM